MLNRLFKPVLLAAALTVSAVPAVAQVQVGIPGFEIRIGRRAPPPLRHERRMRSPGRGYVWITGAWDWQNNDWAWVPGRWDRPADRGVRWIRPRYQREGSAWRYEPGHWSNQRLVEGEDYRRWRSEHNRGRDDRGRRDRDRDRDRDHDRDRNPDPR